MHIYSVLALNFFLPKLSRVVKNPNKPITSRCFFCRRESCVYLSSNIVTPKKNMEDVLKLNLHNHVDHDGRLYFPAETLHMAYKLCLYFFHSFFIIIIEFFNTFELVLLKKLKIIIYFVIIYFITK
jgi:hypothetical protein